MRAISDMAAHTHKNPKTSWMRSGANSLRVASIPAINGIDAMAAAHHTSRSG
jgi:hypothetical protein